MTHPANILPTLRLIRTALAHKLMTKAAVIQWADQIILQEETPDIFFIELALSGSGSTNDILHCFNEYLGDDGAAVCVRPLLGLLYQQFSSKQLTLEQTVAMLFNLAMEATFTTPEAATMHSIYYDLECATHQVYGTPAAVAATLDRFLSMYSKYHLYNAEQWPALDAVVESKLKEHNNVQSMQENMAQLTTQHHRKPWWKFW